MARREPLTLPFRRAALPGAALLSLILAAGPGCNPSPPSPTAPPPPGDIGPRGPAAIQVSGDPWVLSTDTWDGYRGSYLSNGYLGARLNQTGTGWAEVNAERSFVAGNYVNANEALVDHPPLLPLRIEANGRVFGSAPAEIKKYHQEVRLKEAVLVTRATWDTGKGEADLELQTALLRQEPDLALVRVTVDNRSSTPFRLSAAASEGGKAATSAGEWAVTSSQRGVTFATILTPLDPGTAGSTEGVELASGQKGDYALVTQVTGGRPPANHARRGRPEVDAAQVASWLEGHRKAWVELWKGDIEIEGDPEAQQVVRTCLFYLLASTREDSDNGVAPMGLSNSSFSGHVFWDMDSWMLPAVLPQHPQLAKAMLEYRYRTLDGARANAKRERLPGASYAWESGLTGKETLGQGTTFTHGRHVSGDVALALKQYYAATGDAAWLKSRAWPILKATADNWAARAKPEKGAYVVKQVTTPDENAGRVDHSAWTQYVARTNLELASEAARAAGQPADPRWRKVAKGLTFLRDPNGVILSYAGFTEKSKSKQADALLLLHPGSLDLPEAEQKKLYEFYAPRVIANGPAMTDAIHAIAAARLGMGEEALKRFQESYRPFVRPPFHMFSEKRTRDNVCFLTGAAGVVEAVLYGFAGLRLEPDPSDATRAHMAPHLPSGWKALRLRNVHWRGKRWDVEIIEGGEATVWRPK